MYNSVYKRLLFPTASTFLRTKLYSRYKFLKKSERWPRPKIEAYKFERLKQLLLFCYENVKFYHDQWKSISFNPTTDFNNILDLRKIPPLTKLHIRHHLEELKGRNLRSSDIIRNFTGGSTGKPLIFFQTKNFKEWGNADLIRHYTMCGWELGEKHAFLWGAERDEPRRSLFTYLRQSIQRFIWLNSFKMSPDRVKKYVTQLQGFKPMLLIGYTTSLYELAIFIEKNEIKLSIPFVESSAEKLYSFQRKKIGEMLNAEVFDRYGCREVGNIAHECSEHDMLHISDELNHVEILGDDNAPLGDNETGNIAITNFQNYGMPFIRYINEDTGKLGLELCGCGRQSSLMEPVVTRISDNILTPEGKIIHGEYFTHLFYDIPQIKQFQVIQESLSQISIVIAPDEKYADFNFSELFDTIEKKILEWINEQLTIDFNLVDEINVTETGKYRFTVSKVWEDYIEDTR